MKRQSDIEIYVKGCPNDVLVAWIEKIFGKLKRVPDTSYMIIYDSEVCRIIITPSDYSFTSVNFCSAETPWATHVDCGRQAVRDLNCIVHCDPGQNFPEVDPLSDIFLEISADGERLVELEDIEQEAARLEKENMKAARKSNDPKAP